MSERKITIEYNDRIVRQFMLAAILWGVVGMLVGVLIASQLNFWRVNFNLPWLTFGRLRPLHTNAAIFAFVGNMMFAGVYYSTSGWSRPGWRATSSRRSISGPGRPSLWRRRSRSPSG